MTLRETSQATPIASALALSSLAALLGGCGARTEVSGADFDGGAETSAGDTAPSMDTPKPLCPVAQAPSTPLAIATFVDVGPFIASSGCSFAATWLGLENGLPTVEAATFRAPMGTWQASKRRVARGTGNVLNASIVWDGSAYVIGWVDGAVFLQRTAEDGSPLGPATRSFSTDDVLVWLAPGAEGELRVGLASSAGFNSGNGVDAVSYARIQSDGTLILRPTPVANSAVSSSFARAADHNEVLAVAGPDQSLVVESFDDDGVVHLRTPIAPSGGPFSNLVGAGNYFAYLPDETGNFIVLGELGSATRVRIPGTYVPMLAATDLGAVGLLCSGVGPREGNLILSVLHGTTVVSSTHLSANEFVASSDSYAIAGGKESFGALWNTEMGLSFTVLTP